MKKAIVLLVILTSCSSSRIQVNDSKDVMQLVGEQLLESVDKFSDQKIAYVYKQSANDYLISVLKDNFKRRVNHIYDGSFYETIFHEGDMDFIIDQLQTQNEVKLSDFKSSRIKEYIPLTKQIPKIREVIENLN